MIKNNQTFFLGIFLLLIWLFFGIPSSWKVFLTVISAFYLLAISIKINLPKKGMVRRPKKKVTSVFAENSPIIPSTQNPTEIDREPKL